MKILEKALITTFIFFPLFCTPVISRANQLVLGEEKSQAVIHAIERFRLDGYVSDGYQIIVRDGSEAIEIVFVPPLLSGKELFTKDAPNLPEVHYYMDLHGSVVLRKLLGK
jgi:hypothetical protein